MDAKKALKAYRNQKGGAKKRGIGWELTFKQWCEWWGDDIDRRGRGVDMLQMQRIHDKGPYALGNIVKGVPRENVHTWVAMRRKSGAIAAPPVRLSASKEDDDSGMPDLGYSTMFERFV